MHTVMFLNKLVWHVLNILSCGLLYNGIACNPILWLTGSIESLILNLGSITYKLNVTGDL